MIQKTLLILVLHLTFISCISAGTVAEADDFYEQAMTAMQAMNKDSTKSVKAAIYLHNAKIIYQQHERWDRVREVNSYIFYCKKKMNINELDAYIAQLEKNEAAEVRETFARIEKDINQKMTLEDAELSFKDAETFATEQPDQHLKIHIRYLEISERAIEHNTALAIRASRKSSEALQKWITNNKQTQKIESPFFKPQKTVNLLGQETGFPVPDKKSQKKIVKTLKKQFGSQLKKPQGNSTAKELLTMANNSLDQPDYAYTYAIQAAQMAISKNVNDASLMMECFQFMHKHFAVDIEELRKETVSSSRSATAKAILTLFGKQGDPQANKTVGLSYCFIGKNWDEGMQLLLNSKDPSLTKVIAMEKAKPTSGSEQKQLADAWYNISKNKEYKSYALPILSHSCMWYLHAKQKLSGITKEEVETRILAAAQKLPAQGLGNIPFYKAKTSILSNDAWKKVRALHLVVNSNSHRHFTGVTLMKEQRVRILPHTQDTWTIDNTTTNHLGSANAHNHSPQNFGSIQIQVGSGPLTSPKEAITGEGKVYIIVHKCGHDNYPGDGSIRCKIVPH